MKEIIKETIVWSLGTKRTFDWFIHLFYTTYLFREKDNPNISQLEIGLAPTEQSAYTGHAMYPDEGIGNVFP